MTGPNFLILLILFFISAVFFFSQYILFKTKDAEKLATKEDNGEGNGMMQNKLKDIFEDEQ